VILVEEMQRVIAFRNWKAEWGEIQARRCEGVASTLAEGLCAYAWEHATGEHAPVDDLESKWGSMRDRAKATLLDLTSNSLPQGHVQEQIDVEIVLNNDEDEVALGLGTIYCIDGIMVAVYGVHNRPVKIPSRFVPYRAMAHILPYFTAVNTVRVMTYKTCIS